MYVYTCVHIYICTYIHTYMYIYMFLHTSRLIIHTRAHFQICIFMYIYVCVCLSDMYVYVASTHVSLLTAAHVWGCRVV